MRPRERGLALVAAAALCAAIGCGDGDQRIENQREEVGTTLTTLQPPRSSTSVPMATSTPGVAGGQGSLPPQPGGTAQPQDSTPPAEGGDTGP